MPTASIIVLGSTNTDLVIRGPRLPRPGETVIGGAFYQAAGGKGANQAVAAARAGEQPVAFIAAVGDDSFGRETIARLRDEGLIVDYVKQVAARPSGIALIMVDEQGENLISVAPGANADLSPDDVDRLPDEVFRAALVFLASLESPLAVVERGLRRARDAGLRIILNPAPATRDVCRRELLELADVITPNRGEAALLAGTPAGDAESSARTLRNMGCASVIVTLGKDGCLVVDDAGATPIAARHVEAYDATAAGDAFNGTLAVALAEGRGLVEAARWAGAAAAIAVTRAGAQPSLPGRSEIDRLHADTN